MVQWHEYLKPSRAPLEFHTVLSSGRLCMVLSCMLLSKESPGQSCISDACQRGWKDGCGHRNCASTAQHPRGLNCQKYWTLNCYRPTWFDSPSVSKLPLAEAQEDGCKPSESTPEAQLHSLSSSAYSCLQPFIALVVFFLVQFVLLLWGFGCSSISFTALQTFARSVGRTAFWVFELLQLCSSTLLILTVCKPPRGKGHFASWRFCGGSGAKIDWPFVSFVSVMIVSTLRPQVYPRSQLQIYHPPKLNQHQKESGKAQLGGRLTHSVCQDPNAYFGSVCECCCVTQVNRFFALLPSHDAKESFPCHSSLQACLHLFLVLLLQLVWSQISVVS